MEDGWMDGWMDGWVIKSSIDGWKSGRWKKRSKE